jgi:XisH protein
MPRKDKYHDAVRIALEKDGWIISHDPLVLEWGDKDVYVDLGAERLLAAEKAEQRIAVEIKSFLGISDTHDLEQAVGQYLLYRAILERTEPTRKLFLAVPIDAWHNTFKASLGQLMLEAYHIHVIGFDPQDQEVKIWTV